MINEKITNNNKKFRNALLEKNKFSEEFTSEEYSKLKALTQWSKLEDLKYLDKISEYHDAVIDIKEMPKYKFLRRDEKFANDEYIPKTDYGYKNRNKKYTTIFKKRLHLKGFKKNEKIIKQENYLPTDFEEINEQIELKNIDNSGGNNNNKYLLSEEKNINILNKDNNNVNSPKKDNKSRPSTSTYKRNITYDKIFSEPNLNYDKRKDKRKTGSKRIIQSAQKDNKYILNLKLTDKKLYLRNDTNSNLSNYTTSFRSYSIIDNKKNIFKEIEKKVLNPNYHLIFTSKNSKGNSQINESSKASEFKSTKQLIDRIINDGFIINDYIKSNRLNTRKKEKKKDKELILLKLDERLKIIREKNNNIKKQRKHITDEDIFKGKLSLIPGYAKKFFREVYNKILFENRVLSKNKENNLEHAMEALVTRKKLNQEFKKETIKRMKITNDFFVTEKDDQNLIEEQKKLFDFYGNLDGLEWLIMKKNIINYGKKYH